MKTFSRLTSKQKDASIRFIKKILIGADNLPNRLSDEILIGLGIDENLKMSQYIVPKIKGKKFVKYKDVYAPVNISEIVEGYIKY